MTRFQPELEADDGLAGPAADAALLALDDDDDPLLDEEELDEDDADDEECEDELDADELDEGTEPVLVTTAKAGAAAPRTTAPASTPAPTDYANAACAQ